MSNSAIKGEGFEEGTGGFEFILYGDRRFTAEDVRQALSTSLPAGKPVGWTWKDARGRVKVAPHDDWFEKPRNVELLEAKPLYAAT